MYVETHMHAIHTKIFFCMCATMFAVSFPKDALFKIHYILLNFTLRWSHVHVNYITIA